MMGPYMGAFIIYQYKYYIVVSMVGRFPPSLRVMNCIMRIGKQFENGFDFKSSSSWVYKIIITRRPPHNRFTVPILLL